MSAPRGDTQTAEILRLAQDGVPQKQIAEQTGVAYAHVAVALWKLRQRGLLAKPEEIWTEAVLDALRIAIVVDGLKGTAAAARMTKQFKRPFTRNQVVGVALRRGWRAGGVDAAASLSKKPPRWSDEAIAALRVAIAEKLSGSEAAERLTQAFSSDFSRNMTISKAQRLGLQFVSEAKKPCSEGRPTAAPRPSRAMSKRSETIAFLEAEENWTPRRLTLLELREGDCKFPLGDPRVGEFAFCGAPTAPGKVYCGHCARTAYETPAQRAVTRRKWCEDRGLPVGRDWNGRQGSSV